MNHKINEGLPFLFPPKLTGVGAMLVMVTVDFGLILKQLHAEEISAAANFIRAAGTARASMSWT